MKRSLLFTFAALISFIAADLSVSAPRYHLINLGTLEGYPQPEPTCINNRGQVVGLCWDVSGPVAARATLFDTTGNGNNIDLGTLGGDESVAASINDCNQIVGTAEDSQDPPVWCLTAFDMNGSGNNTALVQSASSRCINNHGAIAGSVYTSVQTATLFHIDHPADFAALGTIPGYECSEAYSINSCGDVVGIAYSNGPRNFFETRAVKFDPCDPNNNIDLGTLPGCDWATPFCINDRGQIVGRAHPLSPYPSGDFSPRAVLFDASGGQNNLDLGTIDGFEDAVAYAINNDGRIVGRALRDANMYDCAVMFDPTGRQNNLDLNEQVQTGDDLYLCAATAINDRGWITGVAADPSGGDVAFLLIPLPASVADFEPDGDTDLEDLAVLGAAWKTRVGHENYNRSCDIAEPEDGIIDEFDLALFAGNYLTETR